MTSMTQPYEPTGKEVPFGAGRFLLSHRLGNGSFGDIFEGYDKQSQRIVAVKLERKKARYPQLSYESKVYRVLHQPPVEKSDALPKASPIEGSTANDTDNTHSIGAGTTGTAAGAAGATAADTHSDATATTNPPVFSTPEANIVVGIPQIYYFDSEGDYNIMVMEMCGPSLEDVFNYCHRRFSLKTVLMIADQLLYRIQYFHEKGFVHRDIKPENFVLGCRAKAHILYIIDYGLSKLYWEVKKNTHIPFAEGRPLTGTARYCSANVHRGYEQSRRDDLESIGFLFIYFLQSSLPWQGIQAKDQQLKTIKIGEKKIATPLEDLCKGLPKEFLMYCQYCRAMTFTQKPDYDYLRRLFRGLGKRLGLTVPSTPDTATTAGTTHPGTDPANPLTGNPHGTILDGSVVGSHLPSAINASTDSKASRPDRSTRTVAAQLIAQSDDVDPLRGAYDWEFDWFCKRRLEVRAGEEEQRYKERLRQQQQQQQELVSATAASTNVAMGAAGSVTSSSTGAAPGAYGKKGELHVEDVSNPELYGSVEKVSEGGSNRPLFRGVTGTTTGTGTTGKTSGVPA